VAQAVGAYLRAFETEQPSIWEFYRKLCDVVHPGATSVLSFATPVDDKAIVRLTFSRESQVLAEFVTDFRLALPVIMAAGFNSGMLTLRTLNALPSPEVHTPFLKSLLLKPLPAWDTLETLLAKPDSP
jgi:hypothetical protein